MRANTSYRLDEQVKQLIKRYGGASYIEGCVLVAHLSGLSNFAQRLSLEYEIKGFPDISTLAIADGAALNEHPDGKILILASEREPIDYSRLIKKVEDIPENVPAEYREAIEDLLEVLGDKEDLKI